MARPRRLLWLSAFAGIVYLIWRWRGQQVDATSLPAYTPPPNSPSTGPTALPPASAPPTREAPAGPRRIPTRVHRGSPPSGLAEGAPGAGTPNAAPLIAPDEPAAPAAAALTFREAAVGAEPPDAAAVEAQPVAVEGGAELVDLASLLGSDAASDAEPDAAASPATGEMGDQLVDLAPLLGSDVAGEPVAEGKPTAGETGAELVDLAPLVGSNAGDVVDLAPLVSAEAAQTEASFGGTLVNLNSADYATLVALPGIGPALARRIIAYRQQRGPFISVDQLIDIQGIGTRNIDEFRRLVTV